ncbi:MAG: hypothetical protein CXT73_04545 [Methanobacteriota archaeon]|nr:MAG: hypothetical protein CXT73_04545 [Euryarchaeota archaeon]
MTDVENADLLLQYMRIVVRQQDGILEALNSMQRQNDNLSAILATELERRNSNLSEQPNRIRINRPRTRTFFASTNLPRVRERRPPPQSALTIAAAAAAVAAGGRFFPPPPPPRIVTHHRMGNTTINIPGSVSQSTNTVSDEILNATMNDSPVRVRPSVAQIRRATRTLLFRDISNTTQTICPIDRELLHAEDTVLQIIHCNHFFRDTNLRRHFRGNARCPLCRYDIRDYIPTLEETTFTFPMFNRRQRMPPPPPPPPSFDDVQDPFAALPSTNIIPSQQTTQEIQSLLGEAITNILDTSENITDTSTNE